jgi:hypothetical protein
MREPNRGSRIGVALLSVAIGCFAVATVLAVVNHEKVSLVPVAMGAVAVAQLVRMRRKARAGRTSD